MDTPAVGSPGYVIATLRDVEFCAELERYATEIDATLVPYAGRFIVRGSAPEPLESSLDTDFVVIIEFPSTEHARRWHASADYQAIAPLRTAHSRSMLTLVEGLPVP